MNENKKVLASRGESEASTKEMLNNKIITSFPDNVNRQAEDSRELIVDNFAGGGGASTSIELATVRSVDIAIDHDLDAILMHKTNHPLTKHYRESVWAVNPAEICAGRSVGLMWLSPDCKHFSRAKGGKPVSKNVRGLAWIALRWAATVRPRVIILENVPEFVIWGKAYPRTKQIARCGNAVPPPFAEVLVRANLPEMCGREFESMEELREAM